MSIGVGFLNNVSGRDNIILSATLMGFSRQQINEKMQEIIDFSELGSFIDEPVKSYSSGMHSKLAFSISAIMETNIMLIDETLSVGDRHFKKKSFAKMRSLIEDENKTVLIVSHSLESLRSLCPRVIWLNDGVVKMDGPTETVLEAYEEYSDKSQK